MKITKNRLRIIIREELSYSMREDDISDEKKNLQKNIKDDKEHVSSLKKDIKDDEEEEKRADKAEKRKAESRDCLRNMIRGILAEDKSGKGKCPEDGCVQKRGKGWVIISNKTGQCWGRSKKGGKGQCTYYSSKEKAESALSAYHS